MHGVGEDEEDDLILATALAGDIAYLVTGERTLQDLGSYRDLLILSPRQFLTVREETGGQQ